MTRRFRTLAALAGVATACGMTACGGGGQEKGAIRAAAPAAITASIPSPFATRREAAPDSFVARIADTEAYIGVVVKEGEAAVYVCDGRAKYGWFGGAVEDGEIDFENDNGIRVQAKVGDDRVTGTVDLGDGQKQSFTADPPTGGNGLFRARDGDTTLGWIVLDSGIRGVASDEAGGSKGGFVVKEETGQPGQDSGPGDVGDSSGAGGGTATTPDGPSPQPPQGETCRDFIAGGCKMSCADLQRMHDQQRSQGIKALIRAQMQENECPPKQTPSTGSQPGTSTTPQRQEPPRP